MRTGSQRKKGEKGGKGDGERKRQENISLPCFSFSFSLYFLPFSSSISLSSPTHLLHLSPFLPLPSLSSALSSSSFLLLLPPVSHLSPHPRAVSIFLSPRSSHFSLAPLHLLFLSPCPLSFNAYLSSGFSVPDTVLRKEEGHSQRTWDAVAHCGDQTLVAQRLCQQGASGQAPAWTYGPPATLSLSLISLSNTPSITSCRSYLLNI